MSTFDFMEAYRGKPVETDQGDQAQILDFDFRLDNKSDESFLLVKILIDELAGIPLMFDKDGIYAGSLQVDGLINDGIDLPAALVMLERPAPIYIGVFKDGEPEAAVYECATRRHAINQGEELAQDWETYLCMIEVWLNDNGIVQTVALLHRKE